jgi:hypothetical protein
MTDHSCSNDMMFNVTRPTVLGVGAHGRSVGRARAKMPLNDVIDDDHGPVTSRANAKRGSGGTGGFPARGPNEMGTSIRQRRLIAH